MWRSLYFSTVLVIAPGIGWAQGAPQTLTSCDAQMEDQDSAAAVRCYLAVAHSGQTTTEAVATHLRRRLDRNPRETASRFVLARLRASQGSAEAEDLFRTAIAEFSQASNARGAVLARTALAVFLRQRGRIDESATLVTAADALAASSGDQELVAWVRVEQGWQAYTGLDYGRGLRVLQGIKSTVESSDATDLRSAWRSAMGANLWALGRTDEALARYEEQVDLLKEAGNRYDEASALVNVVLLSSEPARHARALEAARLAHEVGNLDVESSAYFYLSESATPREALAYARRGMSLAIAANSPVRISQAESALALFTLPYDQTEAFRLIDDAIQNARGLGDPNQAVRHQFVKADMRWLAGPRDEAIADSRSLLDAIERLRAFQPEADVRAQRFAQWRYAYYRLAGHLLALHLTSDTNLADEDAELAFETMERMRSRMLLDRLDAAGAVQPTAGSPLRVERESLLRQIAAVNRLLARLGPNAGAQRDQARGELEVLEARAADVAAQLARADPRFGDLHLPHLATVADVRNALAPDEALIAYQTASVSDGSGPPYGAWIWTITKAGGRAVPIEFPERLATSVDLFLGLIERRDNSEGAAAARLYASLIAPALQTLDAPVSKLIIVPDGPLHRLPFDALRATPASAPLALQQQITLAPSATTWLRWRQQPRTLARIPALVLADPALPGYTADAAGASLRAGLWPLPEARVEGRALIRAVGGGSQMFVGTDASELRVKRAALSDYRILHFAAHALIDDVHPERSAVLLAADPSSQDDGYLQAREIAELHLSGQLVLLSSCRSVGGAIVPGEGPLGLAHAFFRAGARTVVATLWPIRDDDAREAFDLVGRSLGRGASVAVSVAGARAALARRGAPAAAWAGLVVMGDGDLVPLPGGRGWETDRWLLGALACALFGAVAWVIRSRTVFRRTARETAERAHA